MKHHAILPQPAIPQRTDNYRPRLHIQAMTRERRQVILDKLAVAAVVVLILATLAVFAGYAAREAPRWRAGQIGGFTGAVPPSLQLDAAPETQATDNIAGTGLGQVPLVLISTAVEMAIFVALGLYLRHDLKRKS
jgi:hypothetical protein